MEFRILEHFLFYGALADSKIKARNNQDNLEEKYMREFG